MKRRNRLSRSRDFDAVYRKGRSVSTRYLTLYWFERADDDADDEVRVGLAVSRKVGGAVQRNRLKRRLRGVFDELLPTLPDGRDYVAIARQGLAEAAEANDHAWLRDRVSEVVSLAAGAPAEAPAPEPAEAR